MYIGTCSNRKCDRSIIFEQGLHYSKSGDMACVDQNYAMVETFMYLPGCKGCNIYYQLHSHMYRYATSNCLVFVAENA